jgi:hypothetical protein
MNHRIHSKNETKCGLLGRIVPVYDTFNVISKKIRKNSMKE